MVPGGPGKPSAPGRPARPGGPWNTEMTYLTMFFWTGHSNKIYILVQHYLFWDRFGHSDGPDLTRGPSVDDHCPNRFKDGLR